MDDPVDRAFETELAELPQPDMRPEARERIGLALRRAEAVRGPWWRRPVPRWRLIAACVLTGVAGFAVARFTAPEFTSLCPVTGQPDFAHLVIDYVPGAWLVESKSLKLYLGSFRNHGAFHEDCTVAIGKTLAELLEPKWLRIGGYWYPRGGIPIDVFWQTGDVPAGVWLPDQGVPTYRGRG